MKNTILNDIIKIDGLGSDIMYLTDLEIRKLTTEKGLIENFKEENLGCVAYDLTVEKIITNGEKESESYNVSPRETVFIATEENIKLPNDCIGIVNARNSSIRMGLDVCAPVYQPNHHTKLFIRVTNVSNNKILIRKGMSVSSIMFCKLNNVVEKPYNGTFTNEFNYTGVGKCHKTSTPMIIDKKE